MMVNKKKELFRGRAKIALLALWLMIILTITFIHTGQLVRAETPDQEGEEIDGNYGIKYLFGLWKATLTTSDPIYTGGGEFREYWPLLSLGGFFPLTFTLIYAPDLQFRTAFNDGRGPLPPWGNVVAFTTNTMYRIVEFEDRTSSGNPVYINVFVFDDSLVFKDNGAGNFLPVGPIKYQIKRSGDYYYLMDPILERVYIFRSRVVNWDKVTQFVRRVGEVVYIMDRNNNTLTFTYNQDNNPTRIEDGLGRLLDFTYLSGTKSQRHLSRVTDGYGRSVNFSFQGMTCQSGQYDVLASFTDALGQRTTLQYYDTKFCNLLKKIIRPLTNSHIDQAWTLNPQNVDAINSQKDAYGNETTLSYTEDANENIITTVTYPNGTKQVFHHEVERYPLDVTDEANKKFTMSYNSDDQLTSLKDRLNDTTSFTYHPPTGKLASLSNAKGNTFTYVYTDQDQTFTNPANNEQVTFTFYNLTQITFPNPNTEQFSYDARGNIIQWTDRAGKVWNYEYNLRGQVTKITYPTGGTLEYTYNADGTLASSKDSDTGTTTYGYDAYKRLNRITRPEGAFVQIAYNLNNRVTSITDENNHTYSYEYDTNGNLTRVTDPAGSQIQYAYDLMDRVNQVTDKLGKVSTLAYNNMDRLQSFTNPNNLTTSYGYDNRGWLNTITIGGQTWQTSYDNEGIVSSTKTPLNYTTTFQSDKLGFITGITNPLSQTTTFARDSMSRITGITDPLNHTTSYAYDSRGFLSEVTLPVIGTATYQRNDLGLLTQITDLNSNNWTFGYTSAGRLQSEADPLGNTWQYGYDTLGRLSTISYPGGGTVTLTYDSAGNITRLQYPDGTDLQRTYDSLDRLLTANNITLTRDAEGRVTSTDNPGVIFGATYDDGGRLSQATYPLTGSGQTFTVTYTYDSTTGLLSRVTDSLTNTQVDFTYDNEWRLTGMTRSNGINTTITWDNAGRPIRFQDGPSTGSGFIDLQYTLDASGRITRAKMTVPLDPASLLQSGTKTFSYDSASRVSTSGYTYDQRGRLTGAPNDTFIWDGASRLTGINGATLAYNGLGDLITRTESGNTIHYYYNYAIGLNPIMAEKNDSTGQFLRYYVWTPGGRLLYMIDAANGNRVYFYHFDFGGSTLALTDSTGAVTDKYAYHSYGKLLAHLGNNLQPFTFLGRWGIRQECPSTVSGCGTLYHIRARYYDPITQRFISREPVWPLIGDPIQINPYQYGGNEPISRLDITGGAEAYNDLWKYDPTYDAFSIVTPPLYDYVSHWHYIKRIWKYNPANNEYSLVQPDDIGVEQTPVITPSGTVQTIVQQTPYNLEGVNISDPIIGVDPGKFNFDEIKKEMAVETGGLYDPTCGGKPINIMSKSNRGKMREVPKNTETSGVRGASSAATYRTDIRIFPHFGTPQLFSVYDIAPGPNENDLHIGNRKSVKKVWGVWMMDPRVGKRFFPGIKKTDPLQTYSSETQIWEGYGPSEGY